MTAVAGSFKIAGNEVYTVKIDRDGAASNVHAVLPSPGP
jgi:hypothetical protein